MSTDPQQGALGTEEMRGYKGYGLALLVEILCGILAGADFGTNIDRDPLTWQSRIGHCFIAPHWMPPC